MNDSERRDRIVEYLRIKPISHGQIYTFQIAIPPAEVIEITSQRREALSKSLAEQGSNLVPLIVRRTEAYSEEEEYEVVYGADWCLLAKELEIEKLWVWVFNMTDEQAATAKAEMQQLVGSTVAVSADISPNSGETQQIKSLLQQFEKSFQQQLKVITEKVEQVAATVKSFEESQNKQTANQQQIAALIEKLDQVAGAAKIVEDIRSQPTGNITTKAVQTETRQKNYQSMSVTALKAIASERNIPGRSKMNKTELIAALKRADANQS
jgi:hypothetical protein